MVSGVANFGGPTGAGFVYEETTPELADNFSYIRGSHSFKFGVSTRWIRDTQVQRTFAQYTFATIAAYQAAVNGARPEGLRELQPGGRQPFASTTTRCLRNLFAQDTWKPVRNLTVTYGLRYDVYQTPEADARRAVRLLAELPHGQE